MENKKKYLSLLNIGILLLIFLSISLYYDYAIYQAKGKILFTKSVQKVFIEREKELKTLLDYSIQKDSISFFHDDVIAKAEQEDISLFIFKNDSLIFWSNNQLSISKYLYKNPFQQNFVQLANAQAYILKQQKGDLTYVGLALIQKNYLYENKFLKNHFSDAFPQSNKIKISTKKGEYPIYNEEGEYIFTLSFLDKADADDFKELILFILYTITFVLLLIFIYQWHQRVKFLQDNQVWGIFAIIVNLVVVRWLLFYFKLPQSLFETKFFEADYFAYSSLFSSLGGFFWSVITFFVISAIFFQNFSFKYFTKLNQKYSTFYPPISFITISVLFYFITFLIKSLILNSVIEFNLLDITQIDYLSLIGFIIFTLLIFTFVMLSYHLLLAHILSSTNGFKFVFWSILYVGTPYFLTFYYWDLSPLLPIFLLLYCFGFYIIIKRDLSNQGVLNSFYFIILFSLFSNFILYQTINFKERENRKILALHLASERDPLLEYNFNKIQDKIIHDQEFQQELEEYPYLEDNAYERIMIHLKNKYFYAYEEKYDFLISLCDPTRELDIASEDIIINCHYYFDSLIYNYGDTTRSPSLWFINHGFSQSNYLGLMNMKNSKGSKIRVFIELFPKFNSGGIGYPELLKETQSSHYSQIYDYSWARYEDSLLIHHSGKYFYPVHINKVENKKKEIVFKDKDGFNHLIYPFGEKLQIVISKKAKDMLSVLSLFSYFFVIYSVFGLILYFILSKQRREDKQQKSLRRSLQNLFIFLVVSSLFITAISSILFIKNLNNEKNEDILSEKSYSVLIELEHKLSEEEVLDEEMGEYLSRLLYKFSLVFFSDINLYDTHGSLLESSRPEIFDKSLISKQMNPDSYFALKIQKRSLFIHEEAIGDYHFLSAYLPLQNKDNIPIAYLNLPYFAKQDEMTKEISGFIASLINIYVILIALSIIAALILSNYITKPIRLLQEKLSKVRLGMTNEHIIWKKQDEIGELVREYNRMLDELDESARLLADSERESAWKDVARQVAHEIKNPLTPMKLSVQMLQKAWDANLPDWEERFKNSTETIIEQIGILDNIASEFSEFAQMPAPQKEDIDLVETLQNSIYLFSSNDKVDFEFNYDKNTHYLLYADNKQIHRAFTNLIKNAIQAIPQGRKGKIKISLQKEENQINIEIEDNGKGISKEEEKKIFLPNFTTKSRGMGIGLSMTRNIIRHQNGRISFTSKVGEGTIFRINFFLS